MGYGIVSLLLYTALLSAPAYNAKRVFKQADGTEFTAFAGGNHHLNWIEDEDGTILKYNAKTKNFEYATIEGIELKPSGIIYTNQRKSISRVRSIKKIDKEQLHKLMQKRKGLRFK